MVCADFVSVVSVYDITFPGDNGISATIGNDVCLQLKIFLLLQGTNEMLELHVDF